MEKRIETETANLIDLGTVAAETRGPLFDGQRDDEQIPHQCVKPGLSID